MQSSEAVYTKTSYTLCGSEVTYVSYVHIVGHVH
jgi:hypothetical protein